MGITQPRETCMVRIQSNKPCGMRADYMAIFLMDCLQSTDAPPVVVETPLLTCDACRKLRGKNVKAMLATDENLQTVLTQLKEMGMPEPEKIRIGYRMIRSAKREMLKEKAPSQESFLRLVTGGKPTAP